MNEIDMSLILNHGTLVFKVSTLPLSYQTTIHLDQVASEFPISESEVLKL